MVREPGARSSREIHRAGRNASKFREVPPAGASELALSPFSLRVFPSLFGILPPKYSSLPPPLSHSVARPHFFPSPFFYLLFFLFFSPILSRV